MPDPLSMLQILGAAALTAAAVVLLFAWPGRRPHPRRAAAACLFGAGLGFYMGCWMLGYRPHWPPKEDQDRFLLVLVPALVVIELVAIIFSLPSTVHVAAGRERWRWLVWLPRLLVVAGAAPVLLYNTSYVADLAGPGSREWTTTQMGSILGGLAGALAIVWASLILLARRPHSRSSVQPDSAESRVKGISVPLALVVACAGAGVTVMFSGYSSGGQMGLALAAAVAGTVIASLVLSKAPNLDGVIGLGLVGLFALVVVGRFFGKLATENTALLFCAPLLCWLTELPYVRRLGPRLSGSLRVQLMAVPVAVALGLAYHQFITDSTSTSAGSQAEPSAQDYQDYGK